VSKKKTRSFSIDEEIERELQLRNDVNASAVVNSYLREFLDAADTTEEEVVIRELNSQIEDLDDEIEEKKEKRDSLIKRRERIKDRADVGEKEKRHEELQKLHKVPDDTSHPLVQDVADELGLTPEAALEEASNL